MDARGSSWSLNPYMNSKQANRDRQTELLAVGAEMAKSDKESLRNNGCNMGAVCALFGAVKFN